jgi:ankyrin repeat protein
VDADSKSLSGLTPLAWAALNGNKGVVELLLISGRVDASYEDSSGQTPLSYAENNGHEEIVELLELYIESLEPSSLEVASG